MKKKREHMQRTCKMKQSSNVYIFLVFLLIVHSLQQPSVYDIFEENRAVFPTESSLSWFSSSFGVLSDIEVIQISEKVGHLIKENVTSKHFKSI
jgi:hypothetical protein